MTTSSKTFSLKFPRREDDFGEVKYKRESTPFAKGVLSLYVFASAKTYSPSLPKTFKQKVRKSFIVVKIGLVKEIGETDIKAHADLLDGIELHMPRGFTHKII